MNFEGTQSRPLPSWNLCTKYLLKYSILGNWVMKWLLYLCLILLWFRYLDGLPKTYFRKVEFNCKVQLSTSDLFWCPKCTSCPYVCETRAEACRAVRARVDEALSWVEAWSLELRGTPPAEIDFKFRQWIAQSKHAKLIIWMIISVNMVNCDSVA